MTTQDFQFSSVAKRRRDLNIAIEDLSDNEDFNYDYMTKRRKGTNENHYFDITRPEPEPEPIIPDKVFSSSSGIIDEHSGALESENNYDTSNDYSGIETSYVGSIELKGEFINIENTVDYVGFEMFINASFSNRPLKVSLLASDIGDFSNIGNNSIILHNNTTLVYDGSNKAYLTMKSFDFDSNDYRQYSFYRIIIHSIDRPLFSGINNSVVINGIDFFSFITTSSDEKTEGLHMKILGQKWDVSSSDSYNNNGSFTFPGPGSNVVSTSLYDSGIKYGEYIQFNNYSYSDFNDRDDIDKYMRIQSIDDNKPLVVSVIGSNVDDFDSSGTSAVLIGGGTINNYSDDVNVENIVRAFSQEKIEMNTTGNDYNIYRAIIERHSNQDSLYNKLNIDMIDFSPISEPESEPEPEPEPEPELPSTDYDGHSLM